MEKVNLKTAGLTKLTDNLLVIDCEDQKIVFAFGINIGYISPEGMFLVKKDFFEGGGKHTVHIKQYIKIIEQTYQLKGSITEERILELEKSVKDLADINEALTREKDITKAQSLLRSATEITQNYPTESNKKIYEQIHGKADKIINPQPIKLPAAADKEKKENVIPAADTEGAEVALASAKKKDKQKSRSKGKGKSKGKSKTKKKK